MSKEITEPLDPVAQFQKNIVERIQADMGKLMPDDMLEKIVSDSVHSILYRNARDTRPGASQFADPTPWIVNAVQTSALTQITAFTEKYIREHTDDLEKMVAQMVVEKGPELIGMALVAIMQGRSQQLQFNVMELMRQMR